MKLVVDVHYEDSTASIAGVMFSNWLSHTPERVFNSRASNVVAYKPGEFYKRELPCILQLLKDYDLRPTEILIDGHVYLDGVERPGLGAFLFESLGRETPVIGIGKNTFKDMPDSFGLLRGQSHKPLYITAAGMSPDEAKSHVKHMHGVHRLPTLVKLADQLCRKYALES